MSARALITLVLGTALIGGVAARAPRPHPPLRGSGPLAIPGVRERIELDGELVETPWLSAARTGAFLAPRTPESSRPYSDARFLHDADNLYVALYAADQDMRRGTDAFLLAFLDPRDGSTLALSISVDKQVREKRVRNGVDSAWESGIRFAVDSDGTLDDASDEDEEWIVEAAIPLASLGVTPATSELRASIARCDTPKDSVTRCGAWGVARDGGIGGALMLR